MLQKVRVALALGSNLGERLENIRRAAIALTTEFLDAPDCSSVYESVSWPDAKNPRFLNAVIVGTSEWKPPAIVNYLKQLELELGREKAEKNAPRLIDVDLLVYGEKTWKADGVTVPHPRMAERDFVLIPLREVWPEWVHPTLHETAEELLQAQSKKHTPTSKLFAPPLVDRASR